MAGELQIRHTTAATGVYAMVFNATGSVWATDSSAFEVYATVDITDYDIAFTELGTASQIFTATFPTAIAAGIYHIFVKDGSGTAAEADTYVTDYWVEWDGSILLPRAAWASGQRISIARALVHEPELLLFDEPFTGLDRGAADLLTDRLLALRDGQRTCVLVTHELHQASRLASEAIVLARGQVVHRARGDELAREALESAYARAAAGGA